ncbi:hypothetical protein GXP67_22100 [Rhodocytophaga rosea]|uniref:Uncharacterized protein n=1 Tax=Rhodocytophaga rosea TaxID=2704465 RepID=A0A6C0GM44_9BACT|nr:hypothetical protein [Rhodocytophaga rosea]QHT69141.1 hypothetical protein GXP67_22100 [Rhodocytophaga rosea]
MPLDPNAPANYSFLPWLRRGIINLADTTSIAEKAPLSVSLNLQAIGDGETPALVERKVQVYGPGDISGIDRRAIVRTIPRAGVRDFEDNFLCAIEFYDEDFPWRYSPFLPATGKLSPWLWLTALREEEFVRHSPTETSLPAIEINSAALQTAFPAPDTTWAWAHTHLNFAVEGNTPAEKRQMVDAMLDQNPNMGCSRLVCPRRLQPGTRYTAFLIPAFEKGRLAGLGKDIETIQAIANAAPSWAASESGSKVFPVYYEWEFVTSTAGDFESLASRLAPLSEAEEQALLKAQNSRMMDIRKPGWGLQYTGTTGAIPLQSALKPLKQTADVPITDSSEAEDKTFVKNISDLLNLGVPVVQDASNPPAPSPQNPFFEDSNIEDDPIIVPPLYGSFYRNNPPKVNPAANQDWYTQLNLNPAFRVAASQGTAVVQKDQETYMDRAWDQLSQSQGTQQVVKRWHYSLEVSQRLFQKRIEPLLQAQSTQNVTENTFRTLAFMNPLHASLVVDNKSFAATLQQKPVPSAYSRSFTKITRPGGPLVRRLNKQVNTGRFFEIALTVAPPKNVLHNSLGNIVSFLEGLPNETLEPIRGRRIRPIFLLKNNFLKAQGFVGIAACKQALSALMPYVQFTSIMTAPIPPSDMLYNSIASQINPALTITARLQSILPATSTFSRTSAAAFSHFPQFPEPMYRPLAERSTDYILPGIDSIPVNRVTMLETNPSFIESYMVGLNHELSREYLWREFPAPLNTTAFRQFWDVRDTEEAENNPEAFKDIKAISTWGVSALGSHPPDGKVKEKIVILVRGDLLKKYPNTEVFMKQAGTGDTAIQYPLFTAQIEPDIRLIGFNLSVEEAIGNPSSPGWFFVLKERAGDIHFGMDIDESTADPSWPAISNEVPENSCINASSAGFKSLPRYTSERSDRVAAMLYQKPFMLFVPASRLVKL